MSQATAPPMKGRGLAASAGGGAGTARRPPADEPSDAPADEGQGDDGDPGGLGHATKLAGRGQNGVCQTVQPEAHHEEGEQGTGQQHGRSLTSAVYAMGGITPTSSLPSAPCRSAHRMA